MTDYIPGISYSEYERLLNDYGALKENRDRLKQERDELLVKLKSMLRGYEADCKCRDVAPDNVMENHTWLAIAYNEAEELIAKVEK